MVLQSQQRWPNRQYANNFCDTALKKMSQSSTRRPYFVIFSEIDCKKSMLDIVRNKLAFSSKDVTRTYISVINRICVVCIDRPT